MNVLDNFKITSYYLPWLQLKLQMGDVNKKKQTNKQKNTNTYLKIIVEFQIMFFKLNCKVLTKTHHNSTKTINFWSQPPTYSSLVNYI